MAKSIPRKKPTKTKLTGLKKKTISKRSTGAICECMLGCGHACKLKTGHRTKCDCKARCEFKAPCGHQCLRRCSSSHSHQKKKCQRRCLLTCLCGKQCPRTCQAPCKPCTERCPIECIHGRCHGQCGDWLKCQRLRGSTHFCPKRCRVCGMLCNSLCGHPCPPCIACKPFKCPISLETFGPKYQYHLMVYMLVDCGCCYGVKSIDTYVKGAAVKALASGERRIKCPNCNTPITKSWRYADQIRQCLYQTVPEPSDSEPREKLNKKELRSVYCSMLKEHPGPKPHWFLCSNGHPYFVGNCGSATQGGRCYECKVPIGISDGSASQKWQLK